MRRLAPDALVAVSLALAWLALVLRGLDLGYTGDLLDYAYHYERLGTFGGMRWLVTEHLHRHLLAPVFSAPLAYLFPNQSAAWYGYAFAAHFAAAFMVYVLAWALLRGRLTVLALAAALVFAFHPLHAELNFEFPTSGHGNSALVLSLVSLWCYVRYVRGRRLNRWWREWALAAYVAALATYEQTVLFFLLHPLIALAEDRAHGVPIDRRWLVRVALDSFWFPVVVVAYLFLLRLLFPPGGALSFAPARVLTQLGAGVSTEFAPALIVERLAAGVAADPLAALLGAGGALVALGAYTLVRQASTPLPSAVQPPVPAPVGLLALFGAALSLVSIAGVAPTEWLISEHPRMIYPSAAGVALLIAGVCGLLVRQGAGRTRLGLALVALVTAVWVGAGVGALAAQRDAYAHAEQARRAVLNAVASAVPAWTGDLDGDGTDDGALPYIVLVTDAHPTDDLYLYAQDNRFPYLFDRLYGTTGIAADALYFDVGEAPPTVPGRDYTGQYLISEPDALWSPLLPRTPIDPRRLVVIAYADGRARVLDRLPDSVRLRANIVERGAFTWETNRALLETTQRGYERPSDGVMFASASTSIR